MMSRKLHPLQREIRGKYLTIREFAATAGIDHSQVYRIFNGRGVNLKTARQMAMALELSLDEFAALVFEKEAA